jgi:crossover junction endodeoxyribonuclease RusA
MECKQRIESQPIKRPRDDIQAQFIFHPPDRRRRDIDNVHAMCKPFQDGVCRSLSVDDSRIKRTVLEWGEVVKGGKVTLTLEEME